MPNLEERVNALEERVDDQILSSSRRHEMLVTIIQNSNKELKQHTQDEMDIQDKIRAQLKTIEEHLSHNDERFSNGVKTFQRLTVEDDKTNRSLDKLNQAVAANASNIQEQHVAINTLSEHVKTVSDNLKPISEAVTKVAAAAPFFEMVGNAIAWVVKFTAPILAVLAGVWAWITEPWKHLT